MPEVWLNYGAVDAVLDVRAENLGTIMGASDGALPDDEIGELLSGVDLARSPTLVVLQDTLGVRQVISRLYGICEAESVPFPGILADGATRDSIKPGLPEGSAVQTFQASSDEELGSDLVFVAEVEPDGLFGYQTICTRLLRKFGGAGMLEAYGKRDADMPVPATDTAPYRIAREFADQFEVTSIEVAGSRKGIGGLQVGHPSSCSPDSLVESYVAGGANSAQTAIGSTGKASSNHTLAHSLPSLWNVWGALRTGGQAVLLAECGGGLGSDSLVRYVEGRIAQDDLLKPEEYVAGMEDVLFLGKVTEEMEVTLVSALPDFYTHKLGIRAVRRSQDALDEILKKSPRRKIALLPDAARIVLRQDAGGEGGADHG